MSHTVNEDIRDQLITHQVQLLRFGKGLRDRIVRLLSRSEPELARRWDEWCLGTERWLREICSAE